jgi:hypothetical protein
MSLRERGLRFFCRVLLKQIETRLPEVGRENEIFYLHAHTGIGFARSIFPLRFARAKRYGIGKGGGCNCAPRREGFLTSS